MINFCSTITTFLLIFSSNLYTPYPPPAPPPPTPSPNSKPPIALSHSSYLASLNSPQTLCRILSTQTFIMGTEAWVSRVRFGGLVRFGALRGLIAQIIGHGDVSHMGAGLFGFSGFFGVLPIEFLLGFLVVDHAIKVAFPAMDSSGNFFLDDVTAADPMIRVFVLILLFMLLNVVVPSLKQKCSPSTASLESTINAVVWSNNRGLKPFSRFN